MSSETAQKKDIQKLQRAIVDGLEDVKAQDIQVFSTEHLSPLFERVVVASGTSNRQTKALAASVRDSVREAGFAKPRTEGEDNGEWIIVDCGQAVVHIMQPAIRQYYHLEDLWGEKPVRLKLGAAKPTPAARHAASEAQTAAAKAGGASLRRSSAARRGADALPARSTAGEADLSPAKPKKAPARRSGTGRPASASGSARTASGKAPAKVVKVNAPKPAAKAAPRAGAKPAARPATKSAAKPAGKPASLPASKPAAKSAARPAAKPAAKKPASRKA